MREDRVEKELCFDAAVCDRVMRAMRDRGGENLSKAVADAILTMIMDGTFASGCKFPNENVMCGLLKIGRGVVREAYQILSSMGVISRSKSGTRVGVRGRIDGYLQSSFIMKEADFYDIQEYRSILEVESSRLAASRASAEDVAAISNALEKMIYHREDSRMLTYYDTMFHMRMVEASHNVLLKNAMWVSKRLMDEEIYHIFENDAGIVRRAIDFHKKILEAVVRKNPVAAGVIMGEHMDDVSCALNYIMQNTPKSSSAAKA
jgi:DNA-binding FadR family transcriptional regulator